MENGQGSSGEKLKGMMYLYLRDAFSLNSGTIGLLE